MGTQAVLGLRQTAGAKEAGRVGGLTAGEKAHGAMLIRLRTKDGLKRVEVGDQATLAQLQAQIASEFGIPASAQKLSLQARLIALRTVPASRWIWLTNGLLSGQASRASSPHRCIPV